MKNHLKLILIVLFVGLFSSCSKDDGGTAKLNYTVYKNQSDDINADALQLNYPVGEHFYSLNFYGNFDENRNPSSTNTITYNDGDIVVNLIINPLTKRISSLFTTIDGINSDVVMKFDYPSDTELKVSFHQYDWATQTSGDSFLTKIIKLPMAGRKPLLINNTDDFGDFIGALAIGVGTAEIVATIGGGWSAIGALSGAAAALVASASAVAIVGAAAIAAVILFLNEASASTITVSDLVPPSDIPLQNPVLPSNNPTSHLQQSPCFNANISFEGTMDQYGSIMIQGVSGGVAPYQYMVESQIQSGQVFPNEYANGSYVIGVKDATGCMSVKLVPFDREFDTVVGNWKLSSRYDETNHEEVGDSCSFNNILNLNSNNTFLGKNYKFHFDVCNLESQFSGNYTVANNTISFSNSAFGGPQSAEIVLVTDTTMKLRFTDNQVSTLETYTKQ